MVDNEATCLHCSEPLSPQAKTCPKCGHPQDWASQSAGVTWGAYLIALIISAIVAFAAFDFENSYVSLFVMLVLTPILAFAWKGISSK